MPQRPRYGYAAGLPRSLPSSIKTPPREFPARNGGRVRAASGPDPPGSSRCKIMGRKRRFLAYSFSPRSPGTRHLAVLTRPGFVRAASRLPGTTRVRLPSASPARCDGPKAQVFHLRSNSQRFHGAPK